MTGLARRLLAACILAAGFAAAAGAAPAGTVVARWIQLGPGSSPAALAAGRYGDAPLAAAPTILARAIVTDGACPSVRVDGELSIPMAPRFAAASLRGLPVPPGAARDYPRDFVQATTSRNFADGTPMATAAWTLCEAVVPPGHRMAGIAGVPLRLPVAHPHRILVLGDSGCRMAGERSEDGEHQQDCHNPSAFPLAAVARAAAAENPDLVIHVGDWFYRDTDCHGAFPGCDAPDDPRYETWGDTFDSWNADVFFPAAPLLAAAPWIMARGNHEGCGRGARGWFALLDPHPFDSARVACTRTAASPPPDGDEPAYTADFTPTYRVRAGVDFLVHDSSFASGGKIDAGMARNEDRDLTRALAALGPAAAVFVTHKPLFGLVRTQDGTVKNAGNATEQAVFGGGTYPGSAFTRGVPPAIGLFLAGHIHQFEYVALQDRARYAPQMIVGIGGTLRDRDLTTGKVPLGGATAPGFAQAGRPFDVRTLDGRSTVSARRAYAQDDFGFAVLDAVTDQAGNTTGLVARVFRLGAARGVTCRIRLTPQRDMDCDL